MGWVCEASLWCFGEKGTDAWEVESRLAVGRKIFGLILFAFLRPEAHQSSRSEEMEPLELMDASMDRALVARSRALRSLRSPTFSAEGSAQDRSAVNIFFLWQLAVHFGQDCVLLYGHMDG